MPSQPARIKALRHSNKQYSTVAIWGDSFSTISPDSSQACSDYDNDQFEDIFYKTSKDESCITVSFISIAFFYAFQDKLLSDFSSSIEYDETRKIYKCTTQLRNLKCHIKLDGNSRSVAVSGVGRIHWRKNDFPRVARIIFKKYVQKSESQFGGSMIDSSQCEVLSAEKVEAHDGQSTSKVQLVFSSTPLISKTENRAENQTENCVNTIQQPVFNSTPTVPRQTSQSTGRRLDTHQNEAPVMNTDTTNTETTQQTGAPITSMDTTNTETNSRMCNEQQPHQICNGGQSVQVPVQTISLDGQTISQSQLFMPVYNQTSSGQYACVNVGDGISTTQPFYIPVVSQTNSDGSEINMIHTGLCHVFQSQAVLPNAVVNAQNMYEPQQMNAIGGEFYNRPTFVISNPIGPQNVYDGANLVPPAYAMNQMTYNDLQTNQSAPVMLDNNGTNFRQTNTQPTDTNSQQTVNNDTTTQMISTIIQRIKGLENQINSMEVAIINNMESKIAEMKSSLVNSIDSVAAKTYSEAVKQCPVIIESNSINEGYGNNTIDITSLDTSQTLPKTVLSTQPAHDAENKKNSPARGIPVRVTSRSNNSEGAINGNSQPTTNVNNVTTNKNNTTADKKTLLIGDSILNPINTKGLVTGIQKHSKSGTKVRNIIDDISVYNMKSFKSVVLYTVHRWQ